MAGGWRGGSYHCICSMCDDLKEYERPYFDPEDDYDYDYDAFDDDGDPQFDHVVGAMEAPKRFKVITVYVNKKFGNKKRKVPRRRFRKSKVPNKNWRVLLA